MFKKAYYCIALILVSSSAIARYGYQDPYEELQRAIYNSNDQICNRIIRTNNFTQEELITLKKDAESVAQYLYEKAYDEGTGDLAKGIALGMATAGATALAAPAIYGLGSVCVGSAMLALPVPCALFTGSALALMGTGIVAGTCKTVSYIKSSYRKRKHRRRYNQAINICNSLNRTSSIYIDRVNAAYAA